MSGRHVLAVPALLIGMLCGGCGDNWQAETYPAVGNVTINGELPVGALVHLHSTGEKLDVRNSRPWGQVKEDGTYALSTYEPGDGAPPGEYLFTIIWPIDPTVPSPSDRLGYRYSRPEQSKWRVTITEGDNTLPPVEMTNVKVDVNPRLPSSRGVPMPGVSDLPGRSQG